MSKTIAHLIKRFRTDERGVFLVIFALLALVLIATSGAVVDFNRVQQARTRAQTALDAAALALQGTIKDSGVTAATLKAQAQLLLTERMADNTITATVDSATPDIPNGKLTLTAFVQVKTYFAQLVGVQTIRANLLSEVTRASSDLEVSLAIDVTGSMAKEDCTGYGEYAGVNCDISDKIGDLIKASNSLIDLLVSTTQTPTYSRMAIVPWSAGVNLGTNADSARGTIDSTYKVIASSSWASGTGKALGAVTKGNPTVITSTAHGFLASDVVYITGQTGMTCLNGRALSISAVTTDTFTLSVNTGPGMGCSGTASGGTATKCLAPSCDLVLNIGVHGKAVGNTVYISNASGINGNHNVTAVPTASTIAISGVFGPTASSYTNTGRVYCGEDGCYYRVFTNMDGNLQRLTISNCVSERTGADAYLDTAPSAAPLGRNYPPSGQCLANNIQPLTSSRSTLHTVIGPDTPLASRTLVATGSTAGHLGLAWGWYMLSPKFGYLWPSADQPAAYGKVNLIKAVVFMTDGQFNTAYNTGVIASDSTSGSGNSYDHINQTASNALSMTQALALCTEIKKPAYKTLLYVVGFDLADQPTVLADLKSCATSADYFYQADTGASLSAAFKAIAQSLSELRVSK